MSITIHTDGSANNMTGKGAWAVVIRNSVTLAELTGWDEKTTSNRMELTAAIEGLRYLKEPSDVTIVTDSTYLLKTMKTQWYNRWFEEERKGHTRPNLDLWHQLVGLASFHNITWVKVKGHSGDYWNERVDKLAETTRIARTPISIEVNHTGEERCETLSYSKQCYLYAGHSGDCKFRRGA